MKPLPTCQQVMTWLCMCPADESTTKKERICYVAFTIIVAVISIFGLFASIVFIVKYASVDLESSLYALFQIAAYVAIINFIIVGLINRHRIADIFTELSELYKANETETSFRFIAEANNKSEWISKVYVKLGMIGGFINLCISSVVSIIYCFYKYGAFDADHVFKLYKLSLPWNQNSLYGYFVEMSFSMVSGQIYMLLNGLVLILFVSMCWHHQAFYKKFRHTALKLNQLDPMPNANEILCDLIRFHISVKDWFLASAKVYSPIVLVQLVCNVVLTAAVIFELDLRIKKIDFEIAMVLFVAPVGVMNLFVYCYFGKLATESYEKMAECLCESDWYERSLDLQKKTLLMIQNMQKPVYYHGFGVAILNLETFVKFIQAVYSYYMIFKTLSTK